MRVDREGISIAICSTSSIFVAGAKACLASDNRTRVDSALDDFGKTTELPDRTIVVLDGRIGRQLLDLEGDGDPSVRPVVVVVEPHEIDSEVVIGLLEVGVRGILVDGFEADILTNAVLAAACGDTYLHGQVIAHLIGQPIDGIHADPSADQLTILTGREREVLQFLARGASNRQIATRLNLSDRTVRFHLSNMFEKLDARSRGEAVAAAYSLGLITAAATAPAVPARSSIQ